MTRITMTIQEALDTINRLRVRAAESGLTASEHQAREAAWAALERASVTVRYQAWLGDALMGEGETEEAAIYAAVAEYEQAIGYGDNPHLYPDREALVADLGVSVAAQVRWQDLQLLDVDGRTPLNVDGTTRRRLLDEYRRTGGVSGAFFAPLGLPHEDPEDASTWGPASPGHVDWTGFPS